MSKGGLPQRVVAHEFGHMMGYRDESVGTSGKPEVNPPWLGDLHSVMNRSEKVRDRHCSRRDAGHSHMACLSSRAQRGI